MCPGEALAMDSGSESLAIELDANRMAHGCRDGNNISTLRYCPHKY